MDTLKNIASATALFAALLWNASGSVATPTSFSVTIPTVWAREDEDEEDHEDREDDEDDKHESSSSTTTIPSTSSSSKVKMKKVVQEFIEYRPVTKTSIVTDEEYQLDRDRDGLVDAVDPDPFVDQRKYFTDSDDDGMPDVLDQHPDEDDFLYYDSESDENGNGILDSYEDTVAEQE